MQNKIPTRTELGFVTALISKNTHEKSIWLDSWKLNPGDVVAPVAMQLFATSQ